MWSVLETPSSNLFSTNVTERLLHDLLLQDSRESENDHKILQRQNRRLLAVNREDWISNLCGWAEPLIFSRKYWQWPEVEKPLQEKLPYLTAAWSSGRWQERIPCRTETRCKRSSHFMSISERTSVWFFHLFASSSSGGSREPGRLSDVRPPVRAHGSHARVLNARSRHPCWKG